MYDIGYTARAFSTSGDPTKNVTVTNFPTEPEPKIIIVCQNKTLTSAHDQVVFARVNMDEYQYMSIFVAYYRPDPYEVVLQCEPSCLNISGIYDGNGDHYSRRFDLKSLGAWKNLASTNYHVGAPYLSFRIHISNYRIELTIVLYCYN